MRHLPILAALFLLFGCSDKKFDPEWTKERAPEKFSARFETTKGHFDVAVQRRYSPQAADRFYQLIKHGYYDNAVFYRVVPLFVAQFGNSDTTAMNQWRSVKVADEPVLHPNKRGTIAFARAEPETRDLDVFVNLQDNPVLDTLDFKGVRGFPAFGDVTSGMDVVKALYSGYGENSMMASDAMYESRSGFLKSFPNLDQIKKAYLLE